MLSLGLPREECRANKHPKSTSIPFISSPSFLPAAPHSAATPHFIPNYSAGDALHSLAACKPRLLSLALKKTPPIGVGWPQKTPQEPWLLWREEGGGRKEKEWGRLGRERVDAKAIVWEPQASCWLQPCQPWSEQEGDAGPGAHCFCIPPCHATTSSTDSQKDCSFPTVPQGKLKKGKVKAVSACSHLGSPNSIHLGYSEKMLINK